MSLKDTSAFVRQCYTKGLIGTDTHEMFSKPTPYSELDKSGLLVDVIIAKVNEFEAHGETMKAKEYMKNFCELLLEKDGAFKGIAKFICETIQHLCTIKLLCSCHSLFQ